MDKLLADFRNANERLKALWETEEYRAQCEHFRAECKRLEQLGYDFLANKRKYTTRCKKAVVRQEYASGCRHLHRGFYSPSLLFPHMIYGAQRGKILSRITSRSNPCFEYGFNDANQMVLCKTLEKRKVQRTEFLLHEQNRIIGFTMSSLGELESISEEVYENGKPVYYVNALFASFLETPVVFSLSYEEYEFDAQGNLNGHWHQFSDSLFFDSSSFDRIIGLDRVSVPIYRQEIYTIPASSLNK